MTSILVASALLLIPMAMAQAPAPVHAGQDLLGLLERAGRHLKDGETETATRLLRGAERELLAQPEGVLRDNLAKTLADLLAKADPDRERWREAFDKAGAELIRTSQSYRRRKWSRVADRLLLEAESLSPVLAARERSHLPGAARTAAKLSAGTPASKPGEPQDLIPKFRPDDVGEWDVRPSVITSPPASKATSAHVLLGNIHCLEDSELSIEIRRQDTPSQAAFVFGAKSSDDYFLLDLVYHSGTSCNAALYRWQSPSLTKLGSRNLTLSAAERADWVRCSVRIASRRVTVLVGDRDLFTAECDRDPFGTVGMHVSGGGPFSGTVQYRRLLLRPWVDRSGEHKKKVDSHPLLKNIAAAERLVEARKHEDATILLLDAAIEVRAQEEGALRSTLGDAIAKVMRRADPSHARYDGSRTAAASTLVALARSYADARWFQLADDILTRADTLDPSVGATLRAGIVAATKAVAPVPSAPPPREPVGLAPAAVGSELAAEPQGTARNLELLLWFEGGSQPYDKDAWRVSTEGATAPGGRVGGTMLLSTDDFGDKAALRIEAQTTDKDSTAGIVFGFQSVRSYHYLLWRHDAAKGLTHVGLCRVNGTRTERIGPTRTFRFSADARRQWMTAKLAYGPQKVTIKLGNAAEFTVSVDAKSLAGKIGLYTEVLENKQPVSFRNLVVEKE